MSHESAAGIDDGVRLEQIKHLSGRCIEERRRRGRITQEKLASDVGISVRWLRDIESGNPKPTIDDHLRCATGVGLTAGYMFIPLMFMEHEMDFPRDLLIGNLAELEASCIDAIRNVLFARLSGGFRLRAGRATSAPAP